MRWKKIATISLASVLGIAALGIGGGLIWRSSLQSDTASNRSQIDIAVGVDELFKTKIGGIDQWVHARGVDKNNPVLLWLHGGPGTPMMPFQSLFQKDIEKGFTVVHWDQRGSGKTYTENPNHNYKATMSYGRMIADAAEVVDMIKKRYGKDKVVIVGHSWGSMLALGLIEARPNDISAYVGTGQVVDVTQNEALGYKATRDEAQRLKNTLAIKELASIAPYPHANGETPTAKINLLRKWQQIFGFGSSRLNRNNLEEVMVNTALESPEYSLRDVSFFLKDMSGIMPILDKEMDAFRSSKWGVQYQIPMFQLLGRHDWQTPSVLAAQWFETIQAPHKRIVWFEKSAHSPMIDEPKAFAKVLIEQVRPLVIAKPLV